MKEIKADKIAKKIKRVLESVPKGIVVVITNNDIQVCDETVYFEYLDTFGHADRPECLAHETLKTKQIKGNNEQL